MKHIILFAFLLTPLVAFGNISFAEKALERDWLVLMHYKKGLFGYVSEVDGEKFFISKNGKRNPAEELEANYRLFSAVTPVGDLHPQCVFPARFRYLKKHFHLSVPEVNCEQYTWWRQSLPFKSLTIIFASYYANNPASIYGHSFLRINSSEERSLSDYGLDFSAITTTDHGLEFAVRGLFGGYTGLFSLKPYYMKINDYIENESRDLWEYDLNLAPEQIDYMLAHLWELMRYGQFDYFFLDENCSYQILTLLEVANPDLDLSSEFYWKTIPIDTIKKIVKSGIVTDIHYRPAFKKVATWRLDNLSKDELSEVFDIIQFKKKPETVESAAVLEATTSSLRYERFEEKEFSFEKQKLLRDVLVRRAKIGGTAEPLKQVSKSEVYSIRPDRSHDSEKYSLGIGNNTRLNFYNEFSARASLNDLIELDRGYPHHSLIETANLRLRYVPEDKRLFFQEFKYAEAISLFPLDQYEFKWSWRAGGRSYRVYDGSCDDCVSHQLKSGGGLAKNLGFTDLTMYGLVLANAEVSKGFYRGYRFAPAVDLGLVWTIVENLKLNYDFEIDYDLNRPESALSFRQTHQLGIALNLHTQHEVRLTGTSWRSLHQMNPVEEVQLNYGFYY